MIAAVVTYFVNSLWQVPLLALCAWLALKVARPGMRLRYGVWVGVLVVAVLLPLRGVAWRSGGHVEITATEYAGALPALPRTRQTLLPRIDFRISPRWADGLALLYVALTAGCVVRLVRAQMAARRLRAGAAMWAGTEENLRLLGGAAKTPMVVGVLRPVILLPAWMREASEDELATVLAHERAHIRRGDLAMNLGLRLLALPIAYHPATAWMQDKVRQTRELLVDAEAARAMGSAGTYAASLLALADHMISDSPHAGSGAGAMLLEESSRVQLEERLMNLIEPSIKCGAVARVSRIAAGCVVMLGAVALAATLQVSPRVLAAQREGSAPVQAEMPTAKRSAEVQESAGPMQSPVETGSQAVGDGRTLKHAEAGRQAEADAAVTAERMEKLSAELAQEAIKMPELQRQMAEMRQRLESPEFRKQLEEMSRQVSRTAMTAEKQRKLAAEVERQVNSPEFRRQIAQIQIDSAKMEKQIAEAHLERLGRGEAAGAAAALAQEGAPARVSAGVMAGQRVSGDAPVYPPDAKAAHIAGAVVLHAVIGTDGTIEQLQVVQGPEELRESAMKAVRTWVYKPYLLNGVPTAVDTTITVTYSFSE